MFQRRKKLSIGERLRGFVWPRSGWQRSTWYLFHRLARMPGTAYSIAAGFACGAAVSFTPFVGLHFVFAALIAWAMRANILASAIGTAVGNPWTFPFIWVWVYKFGRWLGADTTAGKAHELEFAPLFGDILHSVLTLNGEFLFETAWPVWWPMLVGSVPSAIVVWAAFYWPLKLAIENYQDRRLRRRLRNLREAEEQ